MAQFVPQTASKENPWALLAERAERNPVQRIESVDNLITNSLKKTDAGLRAAGDSMAERAAEQEAEYQKRSKPVNDAYAKTKKVAGDVAETTKGLIDTGTEFVTDTAEQTKSALNDMGIEDFSLDSAKKLVKDGGEAVVPVIKQGVKYAKGLLGENAPSNTTEGFGTVLATPTPKLTDEEKKQVPKLAQEEIQDSVKAVVQHNQIDPDTEEGRNAWERTANYLKVPVDWLIDSWKALDEKAGGYPSGVAGLLGDAGGAVAEGASYLDDKVDFFQMLAIGAQAASRTNNVGLAVLQGLAGGIQARQQQKAAMAKQKRDDARWNAEQNVREYNALTTRGRAVADAQKQGKKNNLLELTTSDNKMVDTVSESLNVSKDVVQAAAFKLKASGKQYGPQQLINEVERMKATGEVSDKLFGTDKLM